MTKILLVGGGAREHAIAEALVRSGALLYACLPNANPGILSLAQTHALVKDTEARAIAQHAKAWGVEYAVVGPDAALAAGVTDELMKVGVKTAAPTKNAAEIEWNKAFMRDLLERHRISGRVKFELHQDDGRLRESIAAMWPLAVKPLGLTGGKGVKVSGDHVQDVEEALAYANECLRDGGAVLLEEKVEGEEFSLMAFCDGTSSVAMPAVQDHKRAFEGDLGPNTGGMGSYSDAGGLLPFVTKADYEKGIAILDEILAAMKKDGRPFVGTIYGQFMLAKDGPRVIEINARFGDPEAMNVLTLLESSYVEIVKGMAAGKLDPSLVRFADKATVCKYVVPEGYGVKSKANEPLSVDEKGIAAAGARCYYAAVNQTGGKRGETVEATTTTSRAVGVVGVGATLAEANAAADKALAHVTGPHLFVRRDIGTPALLAKRVETMRRVRGRPLTVAYQGEPGAYGEQAALRSASNAEAVSLPTLDDVFAALAHGRIERAVAAIENSQVGSIHRTYDLLRRHDVFVVGEVELAVDHCLLALPGERIETLTRVHSHPAALEQCDEFLRERKLEAVAHADTAGAARMIAHERRAHEGALASRRAAEVYGLAVLAEAVQTIKDNRTRFVVLAREPAPRGATGVPQKTMLVLATDHRPGALHAVIGAFATRGVNLLKLESRPSRGQPWEYVFYLDVDGHRDDVALREAIVEVGARTLMLKVLGSFAAGSSRR